MMRTLAVTVFAMSLTLIGCGSSSTSKKDAATDATPDVTIVKTDVAPNPDTTKDTGVIGDTKVADTAIDTDALPGVDVPAGDTLRTDTAQPDAFVRLDVNQKTDTTVVPVVDAPVASDDAISSDAGSDVGGDAQVD